MSQTAEIINRVLPVFLLIFLGYWIRRRAFVAENTIEDLRKVVVNLALPAVLFISFLQTPLELVYLALFISIFLLCVGLLWLGFMLQKWLRVKHPYFPYLITGFEYGMLGISLFGSAYGLERLGYIAIVDLGHELFIWFVFMAFLLMKRDQVTRTDQLASAFVKSPVILAILAGLALNLLGLRAHIPLLPVVGGVMTTLQFLGNLTIPLVLIIVGYGIRLDMEGIREALPVLLIRLGILIPLASILNIVLIGGVLGLGKPLQVAFFTLLILPPPFIVPLYMKPDLADEKRYVNNVLTLHTLVSILIYAIYFAANPTI